MKIVPLQGRSQDFPNRRGGGGGGGGGRVTHSHYVTPKVLTWPTADVRS